jgi:thiamine transport system permease protein
LQLKRTRDYPVKTITDRLLVWGNLTLMLLLLGLPLLALLFRSFLGSDGLTFRFYRQLTVNERGSLFFVPPGTAVFNSVGIALTTLLFAVTIGLISVYLIEFTRQKPASGSRLKTQLGRWIDPLLMLPIATSAVTLGFGYIIALNKPPLNLRQSLILVPIAHALVAIPFVIRAVLPAVRRIDPKLREAAMTLGAESAQVWRHVEWPLIRRAVLVGAVFAFTISMGEFGATVFIARPNTPTMPVAIFRFLGQPGALNYGQALAMSSLLMLVCTIGFIAIERFRLGEEGEF